MYVQSNFILKNIENPTALTGISLVAGSQFVMAGNCIVSNATWSLKGSKGQYSWEAILSLWPPVFLVYPTTSKLMTALTKLEHTDHKLSFVMNGCTIKTSFTNSNIRTTLYNLHHEQYHKRVPVAHKLSVEYVVTHLEFLLLTQRKTILTTYSVDVMWIKVSFCK